MIDRQTHTEIDKERERDRDRETQRQRQFILHTGLRKKKHKPYSVEEGRGIILVLLCVYSVPYVCVFLYTVVT